MDKRIVNFIKEHHLLSLSTCVDNIPYISSVYYIFSKEKNSFFFSSDTNTKHVKDFIENPIVAMSIAIETKLVSNIKGLQILGRVKSIDSDDLRIITSNYLSAFPYASNMKLNLWQIQITFVKMTDNSLGFGKKIIWEI